MTGLSPARARIVEAFGSIRRRAAIVSAFLIVAHGALGALFGTLLAWSGGSGAWGMGILAILAAAGSAAWTLARLPAVAAGRLLEQRFPECRNVFITADEVLDGTLDVNETAAERVFARAAGMLAEIDTSRAVAVGRRVTISLAVTAASAAVITMIWRAATRAQP